MSNLYSFNHQLDLLSRYLKIRTNTRVDILLGNYAFYLRDVQVLNLSFNKFMKYYDSGDYHKEKGICYLDSRVAEGPYDPKMILRNEDGTVYYYTEPLTKNNRLRYG